MLDIMVSLHLDGTCNTFIMCYREHLRVLWKKRSR